MNSSNDSGSPPSLYPGTLRGEADPALKAVSRARIHEPVRAVAGQRGIAGGALQLLAGDAPQTDPVRPQVDVADEAGLSGSQSPARRIRGQPGDRGLPS